MKPFVNAFFDDVTNIAPGRDDYRWETTVAEECKNNVHVHEGVTESEFVKFRTERGAISQCQS